MNHQLRTPHDPAASLDSTAVARRNVPGRPPKVEKLCRLCRKYRRGAAVVEFAVVAPLFFLLIFGMIEFGRVIMVQQLLTNASREGARVGVLDGETDESVRNRVTQFLSAASIQVSASNIVIDPPLGSGSSGSGEPVTVSVSVPFNQVSWLPSPMFLDGYTLSASSSMRRESVQ